MEKDKEEAMVKSEEEEGAERFEMKMAYEDAKISGQSRRTPQTERNGSGDLKMRFFCFCFCLFFFFLFINFFFKFSRNFVESDGRPKCKTRIKRYFTRQTCDSYNFLLFKKKSYIINLVIQFLCQFIS